MTQARHSDSLGCVRGNETNFGRESLGERQDLGSAGARGLIAEEHGREVQSPCIVPSMLANGNSVVADLSKRIGAAMPRTTTVADLATQFSLTQREPWPVASRRPPAAAPPHSSSWCN
jgi:hypothetical protein